jgi:hypothetical protein
VGRRPSAVVAPTAHRDRHADSDSGPGPTRGCPAGVTVRLTRPGSGTARIHSESFKSRPSHRLETAGTRSSPPASRTCARSSSSTAARRTRTEGVERERVMPGGIVTKPLLRPCARAKETGKRASEGDRERMKARASESGRPLQREGGRSSRGPTSTAIPATAGAGRGGREETQEGEERQKGVIEGHAGALCNSERR